MGHNNEFSLLSLNVRGIRAFEKRKAVFICLVNSGAYIESTYFSFKKHTALEKLKITGENNGKAKCSSRMAAVIAEVFYSTDKE